MCAWKILVLSLAMVIHAWAESGTADLWILSGQSNACGHGDLPGPDPDPGVKMWNGQQFVEAKEPLATMNGSVGPWLFAALEVAKAGKPIKLTGWAMGARSIDSWSETGPEWRAGNGQGLCPTIEQSGRNAGVFLWYQGETDGVNNMKADEYLAKLTDLVRRVRAQAKNPQMMAVIVQIGLWGSTPGDFMPIREAQRRFVVDDGNALLVPALGRSDYGDSVHLNTAGYKALGHELARALLKVHYGKKDVNWPGPVMDSAALASNGKSVAVHFAEVKKLAGVKIEDFGVLDAVGPVPCVKAEAADTRVILTFERVIKLPARVVCGFGQNPPATLVDEAGNRAPAVQLDISAGAEPPDKETAAPNGAGRKAEAVEKDGKKKPHERSIPHGCGSTGHRVADGNLRDTRRQTP
ncbi:MAG: hypothetical protein H0W83_00275 [Planctomycetes bacterium]|nr:hypothetical protein [Planctomycetota bacterium]